MSETMEQLAGPLTLAEQVTTSLVQASRSLHELNEYRQGLKPGMIETGQKVSGAMRNFVLPHLGQPEQISNLRNLPLSMEIRQEAAGWLETELGDWVLEVAKKTIIEEQTAQIEELLEGRLITAKSLERPFDESTDGGLSFMSGALNEVTGPYANVDPYNAVLYIGTEGTTIWEIWLDDQDPGSIKVQ